MIRYFHCCLVCVQRDIIRFWQKFCIMQVWSLNGFVSTLHSQKQWRADISLWQFVMCCWTFLLLFVITLRWCQILLIELNSKYNWHCRCGPWEWVSKSQKPNIDGWIVAHPLTLCNNLYVLAYVTIGAQKLYFKNKFLFHNSV